MKKLLIPAGLLCVFGVLSTGILAFWVPPRVAGELSVLLSARTGYDVEVGDLGWSLFPRLQLVGQGIRVGGVEMEKPLIDVGEFTLEAELSEVLARPRHFRSLRVSDLTLRVPARGSLGEAAGPSVGSAGPSRAPLRAGQTSDAVASVPGPSVLIDQIIAERASIQIARTNKPFRVFDIQALRLGSVALDRPISFEASLTNPRPIGRVETTGYFGPWNRTEVRDTPISGEFEFTDADLAEFRGIGGMLSSTGNFQGTLGVLVAQGEASIPDFKVSIGQVVPLQASFEVEVGDNGVDVQLEAVSTRFFDSELVAAGEVVRVPANGGRAVIVDVTGESAMVEDLVRFALNSEIPPLTGPIELKVRLEIPPGEGPVLERMRLTGDFAIREARFANLDVQRTLAKISQIGSGETDAEPGASVVSDLNGAFEMADAELRFSRLTFAVPDMQVRLVGGFGLREESLNFGGHLRLQQAVSQLAPRVPGSASRWLRLLDPLFQTDEAPTGTVVPITITGFRSRPSFGVELADLTPDWRRLLENLLNP